MQALNNKIGNFIGVGTREKNIFLHSIFATWRVVICAGIDTGLGYFKSGVVKRNPAS